MVICLLKMFILYINVDGSYISTMAKAVCGGPVRDYEGRMIKGIYTNLGTCHSLWVELWGMYYSIQVANNLGFNFIFKWILWLPSTLSLVSS